MRVRWTTETHVGRPGRVEGTRELAFPPLPYIAVYEIAGDRDEVRLLRILHGAQQWPQR
jgi:toxin ParE1/3/4